MTQLLEAGSGGPSQRTGPLQPWLLAVWALALLGSTAAVVGGEVWLARLIAGFVIITLPGLRPVERAALLMNLAILTPELWIASAVAVVTLLAVPGLLMLDAVGLPRDRLARYPVYVPAGSIVVLMVSAFVVNAVGPPLGVERPLERYPLLVGVDIACAVLAGVAVARTGRPPRIDPALVNAVMPRVRDALPLLLPLGAAIGAGVLNAGGTNLVAVTVAGICLAWLLYGLVIADGGDATRAALILFGTALALTWSFSLRGSEVFGWDISGEFSTFQSVVAEGFWERAREDDAYGAMLSLTLLPATLTKLTGLSAGVVFRAVFPALLAFFPLSAFLLARRVVSLRSAYVVALLIVAQGEFVQGLPALARQEIGLLQFMALLGVVSDRALTRRVRAILVIAFSWGIVVSHYSTAYATVGMFGVGIALALALRLTGRRTELIASASLALAMLVVSAAAWYGPITSSGSNATSFLESLTRDGLRLLPSADRASNPLDAYLSGNVAHEVDAEEYEDAAADVFNEERPWVVPLPDADQPRYALEDAEAVEDGDPIVSRALGVATVATFQVSNVLCAVGALMLLTRRRASASARVLAALSVAMLCFLVVARFSGQVAESYNLERLAVQALPLIGIGAAYLLDRSASSRRGQWLFGAYVGGLTLLILASSGLGSTITGSRDGANLYSRGESFDRFAMFPGERAAAAWFGANAPTSGALYADRYAQLRLFAFGRRGATYLNTVTPRTLDRTAWVYVSRQNLVSEVGRDSIGDVVGRFRYPTAFLDDNFDRVYANQDAAVYGPGG